MFDGRFNCPIELAMTLLGGKWKVVLLALLKSGPRRYAELRAATEGLSDKVLTERLRELVAAGLVLHNKQGVRGSPSTYRLSARAEELRPALDALYQWGLTEARRANIALRSPQAGGDRSTPRSRVHPR